MKKLSLLLVVTMLMSIVFAINPSKSFAATNYYVATTGSDSNDGSSAHPFLTIQKAADVATAGSTVFVSSGTYTGTVRTNTSGTASQRIVFKSVTKWGAIINVTGYTPWWDQADYVDIQGFEITGDDTYGIVYGGSYGKITGNKVHDLGKLSTQCTSAGGAGIVTYNDTYSNHDIEISGNVVYNIGPSTVCNYIHGIYASGNAMKVMNNIVYNNAGFGIHDWHMDNNLTITNNLVFGNRKGGIILGSDDITVDNSKVNNNIVMNNTGNGITELGLTGTQNVYQNNQVLNNTGSAFSLQNGNTDSNTITSDPKFVNWKLNGSGDYHLQSTSPSIDSGTSNGAPTTDYDNNFRPQGAGYDRGPYEYITGTFITIGNTNIETSVDYNNSSILNSFTSTLSQTATLKSISIYIDTAAGTMHMGIYSNSSGNPGTLLATTAQFTPTTGWNTVNVTTPVQLTSGTYWLSFNTSSNSLKHRLTTASGTGKYKGSQTYGNLPSSFPSSPSSWTAKASLYATLSIP